MISRAELALWSFQLPMIGIVLYIINPIYGYVAWGISAILWLSLIAITAGYRIRMFKKWIKKRF